MSSFLVFNFNYIFMFSIYIYLMPNCFSWFLVIESLFAYRATSFLNSWNLIICIISARLKSLLSSCFSTLSIAFLLISISYSFSLILLSISPHPMGPIPPLVFDWIIWISPMSVSIWRSSSRSLSFAYWLAFYSSSIFCLSSLIFKFHN
jgi:hypothetical protein